MANKLKWIMVMVPALILIALPMHSMAEKRSFGKWWRLPNIAERLQLNDAEKKELDRLYVDNRRSLIDLKGVVEKERFELGNLMEQTTLDEDAVMKQFNRLEKARANLGAERFRFFLGVRKVLGSERYQSLKMLFKTFREKRRHTKGSEVQRGAPEEEGKK